LITYSSQRHKLGSNLTPVTPETFAKWKQNRQNKKEAEAEALKKTKDTQAAAGKSSGMSGRDLVRVNRCYVPCICCTHKHPLSSSNTILSGSKTKKTLEVRLDCITR
jgi:DRG Family Regulatory Proteins, Tma46